MGLIRAAVGSLTGALKDQFLDAVEPYDMGEHTVFTVGRMKHKQTFSDKGEIISNGSAIHVYDNQFMILTDGGKIVDYTAEPGYFIVDNSSSPSMFSGEFKESLLDAWERFKFGGGSPKEQRVYYINLQEIKGIKFGTRNAVNYFDNFYNCELFLRAFGTYSIKINNPILFYQNSIPRNAKHVDIGDINEQYLSEFLEAFQAAINQMSMDGERISFVTARSTKLSKYMSDVLDESWTQIRGMEVVSVGIASISYDEQSQKLINMRNQGAMMGDPTIREGYVQSAIAQGLQNAGSNANGAAAGYMGIGLGMQSAGGFGAQASQTNFAQMQMNAQYGQGQYGQDQYRQAPQQTDAQYGQTPQQTDAQYGQTPQQGAGTSRRMKQPGEWFCPECGALNSGKFCTECGTRKPE